MTDISSHTVTQLERKSTNRLAFRIIAEAENILENMYLC